ncbi:hypothetical protein B0A78_02735 [Flavobacterium columnare NBRC 100251 = ATCC 23463]|uniref:Mucoidy inhibitor MuiA family protein n=2 Tax=Flavobacterium columnare TaxID=996 RepID=G8XBQ5_FLACA|nr:DUF4139 domain-containing protein [Flavobacterium columnare]AEW87470.1 hypothetical protein FCOL_13375 [Flavobacterium columnare ATCC 49512]AMO20231.1 DUF4139 domain-containing protein [Flavobacterium columnare]APT22583.1 hypothetical protein BU993_08075 [Flavobacterium columnare]AUX18185.1 hypothetical protein AQ623_07810 [Flavobacterium columnare]MBF6651898.1 DUF4139 domain-containing protein [Flavobacterium columnare]
MQKILIKFILLTSVFAWAQNPIFTQAKTKEATVYFNSAEIIQQANIPLTNGTHEVVVKNVANYLNENSIQISTPSHVTILSIQFTNDYISEYDTNESSPEIKRVKDSISLLKKELNKVTNIRVSEQKTIELLDKNQQVFGQNSGLSVLELSKMVEYYKLKRTETSNTINILEEREKKLLERLNHLNTKLETNNLKNEKTTTGKLVLQLMNTSAGNIPLEISYITPNASWIPFYDLRTENIKDNINLIYKAQVYQSTGLDWKKIKLTLSSGNPNQNNQAPILNSWFLTYGYPSYGSQQKKGVMNQLQSRVAGGQINTIEAESALAAPSSISNYTNIVENQLQTSFEIDIPYDILSNGKAHSVSLKDFKIPASFKYYAAPKIEKEAFLMAEIKDYTKYNLLAGEANIIFEGLYVGKTFINPNQTSDTLNLSMGRDKKVSIKREKVMDLSGVRFLSSKKEQTFTYDIVIKNNKKETIYMLLKDQYPLSTDKEIEIELTEKNGAKVNPETGILTWDLQLKPNEIQKIRIRYIVKYPKDKIISNL